MQVSQNYQDAFQTFFVTYFDYSTGTFLAELLLDFIFYRWRLVLLSSIFLMNQMKRSFNISNFISSHSQVFGHLDVLKKLRKKRMCWRTFLVNLQAFTLQSAQTFSCEFCKNFENTILIENLRLTPSVTLTLDRLRWVF